MKNGPAFRKLTTHVDLNVDGLEQVQEKLNQDEVEKNHKKQEKNRTVVHYWPVGQPKLKYLNY